MSGSSPSSTSYPTPIRIVNNDRAYGACVEENGDDEQAPLLTEPRRAASEPVENTKLLFFGALLVATAGIALALTNPYTLVRQGLAARLIQRSMRKKGLVVKDGKLKLFDSKSKC
jgi:hypothetical protein